MRIVWMWIVPLVVVAGIVLGISYFHDDMFPRTPGKAADQQQAWVAVPHPPGDRVQPQVPVVKEFGSWHVACFKRPDVSVPKVGYVQNLGMVAGEGQTGKPERCHAFITMRDPAAERQFMTMNFRYRTGLDTPELDVIYTSLGTQHVIYDKTGQVHNLTRKDEWHGGFYTDPKHAPPAMKKLAVQHEDAPVVRVGVGGTKFDVPTSVCIRGRCLARNASTHIGDIGPGTKIVVELPGPPHGRTREVDVPADGLGAALSELERARSS